MAGVRVALAATAALLFAAPAVAAPGDLDAGFSGDGWVRTLEVQNDTNNFLPEGAEDIALQPYGKIVAVGEIQDGSSDWYFGVFRYLPNGDLDPSFGDGGWVATDLGAFASAHAVAVQENGMIVVAGEALCPSAICFTLARYKTDGSLDSGFGGDGVVRTMFGQCGCAAYDVALQSNGRITAVGYRFRYGDHQDDRLFAIARYLADGRLDRTFSGDGRAFIDFGYGDDIASAVALQADGKIVVAGRGTKNLYLTKDDFAFARFRSNGTLDPTFSGDGLRTVHFGSNRSEGVQAMDIQHNGRIVVAGSSGPRPRMALARLNGSGGLDESFGSNGRQLTRPTSYGGYAFGIAQHPDGRIIVGGRGFTDAARDSSDWILARYQRNGTLDTSFGGGIVRTNFGTGSDWAGELAIQADGKIVGGGSIYESLALARYLPD